MNRLYLFVFLQFAFFSAISQVQTHLVGDSVRIHSNNGKAELILQNATDSVKGFLFNKGSGKTEFRKGLIKINDSLYLIGADTLRISVSGSTGNLGLQQITLAGDSTSNRIVVKKLVTDSIFSQGSRFWINGVPAVINKPDYLNTMPGRSTIAIGDSVLFGNTTGYSNIAFGSKALKNNVKGSTNIGIGVFALQNNDSSYNTAVGHYSMQMNTKGTFNSAYGGASLYQNTTGYDNVSIGYYSMLNNSTGSMNTALGVSSMRYNIRGNNNVALGRQALYLDSSGNNNVSIGFFSGFNNYGSGNVFIGFQAGYNDTSSNKLYISNSATSRPLIYGRFSDSSLIFYGSVTTTSKQSFTSTITPGGTTGAAIINTPSGTVNIAAGGTSVTVTNSLVTASSIVIPVIRTNDSTAIIKNVVLGTGLFTINLSVAATAEISIGFIVYN